MRRDYLILGRGAPSKDGIPIRRGDRPGRAGLVGDILRCSARDTLQRLRHALGKNRPGRSTSAFGWRAVVTPNTKCSDGPELTSTGVPTGIERQKRLVRYCRGYLRPSACVVPLNWP